MADAENSKISSEEIPSGQVEAELKNQEAQLRLLY